jgi:hypothetical protein
MINGRGSGIARLIVIPDPSDTQYRPDRPWEPAHSGHVSALYTHLMKEYLTEYKVDRIFTGPTGQWHK